MAPQFTATTIISVSSTPTPSSSLSASTITSFEVIPTTSTSPSTHNGVGEALKTIPPWAYVLIIFGALLIGRILFLAAMKCYVMVKQLWQERKDASMWKDVEEGRRQNFVEALRKLEGNYIEQENRKESESVEEIWEEINLNEPDHSTQSKDCNKYVEDVLERIKALDSADSSLSGGSSPPDK